VFSHIHIGVSDLDKAIAFYGPLLGQLGLDLKFREEPRGWAGWVRPGQPRPLFILGRPFDGGPAEPGNGQMAAFLCRTREHVDRIHADALAAGASDEGAPGLRPEYHANYYGAYFRDPDGNKICVCCHEAEDG
jgi:catechol 2,3-dioxygenase-like lactoylglutathione lyase family enzyme